MIFNYLFLDICLFFLVVYLMNSFFVDGEKLVFLIVSRLKLIIIMSIVRGRIWYNRVYLLRKGNWIFILMVYII